MAYDSKTERLISLKKLAGKAHTSNDKGLSNEGLPTGITSTSLTIFAEAITGSPNSGALFTRTGAVEYVRFPVEFVAGSSTASGRHGFQLKLPSNYESTSTNPKKGTWPFKNGVVINQTVGQLQLVPPSFADAYEVKPFYGSSDETTKGDGTQIALLDVRDWYMDYFNGIYFQQDPPGTGDHAENPDFVEGYLYIGETLSGIVEKNSSGHVILDGTKAVIGSTGSLSVPGDTFLFVSGNMNSILSGTSKGGTGVAADSLHGASLFGGDVYSSGAVWAHFPYYAREIDPPPTPPSGYGAIYVNKSDSKLYFKDDSGTATNLLLGGGGGASPVGWIGPESNLIETTGSVGISGSLFIADFIKHQGDDDTSITFDTNKIQLKAGNINYVNLESGVIQLNGDTGAVSTVINTANKTAIAVNNATDQVLILSGGSETSFNEAGALDVGFYVSGSASSRGTNDVRGTALFGGDVVVSASAYHHGDLAIVENSTAGGKKITFTGNFGLSGYGSDETTKLRFNDGSTTVDLTGEDNEGGGNTASTTTFGIGSDRDADITVAEIVEDINASSLNVTATVDSGNTSTNASFTVLEGPGATLTVTEDPDNNNSGNFGPSAGFTVITDITSTSEYYTMYVDSSNNQVSIMSGSKSQNDIVGPGPVSNMSDVVFWVSGTRGAADRHSPGVGVAAFGGDLVVSGALVFGDQEQTNHAPSAVVTNKSFVPFNNVAFDAPAGGAAFGTAKVLDTWDTSKTLGVKYLITARPQAKNDRMIADVLVTCGEGSDSFNQPSILESRSHTSNYHSSIPNYLGNAHINIAATQSGGTVSLTMAIGDGFVAECSNRQLTVKIHRIEIINA